MLLDRLGGVGATGSLLGRQLLPLKVKTPIKPWKTENTLTLLYPKHRHSHHYSLKTHSLLHSKNTHSHYYTLKTHIIAL